MVSLRVAVYAKFVGYMTLAEGGCLRKAHANLLMKYFVRSGDRSGFFENRGRFLVIEALSFTDPESMRIYVEYMLL